MSNVEKAPLHERPSDYVYAMTALNSAQARRQWRAGIRAAWNDRCAYCGQPPIDEESLTIDHVKPRCKGGEDRTSNVIPACRSCNQAKGSEEWVSWYSRQAFYSIYAEARIRKWIDKGTVDNYEDTTEDSEWLDQVISGS
jgi:hypothetical protein